MARIDAFFKMMNEIGASDLHLSSGSQPVIRLHGDLQRIKYAPLRHEELKDILYEIVPEKKKKEFEQSGDVDFSYELPGVARYRANFFQQRRGIAAAFRKIPQQILSIEELGLFAIFKDLAIMPKDLVL